MTDEATPLPVAYLHREEGHADVLFLAEDWDGPCADCTPLYARAEAAEKDAARYRWLLSWLVQVGLLRAEFCQPEAGMKAGDYWVFHRPAVIDGSSCLGYAKSEDAAIDAAITAGG